MQQRKVFLTITRYNNLLAIAGFFSMAFFKIALWINKDIRFHKLMGTGKNGTFSIWPDWKQWAIFSVHNDQHPEINDPYQLTKKLYGGFVSSYLRLFAKEIVVICLVPVKGHGTWDGDSLFNYEEISNDSEIPIAVITRASIRLNRIRAFWKHVPIVAQAMKDAEGLLFTFSIGETPWIKQATFSIWENTSSMQSFAYKQKVHKEIIKKTHQERWYSEEMFVRFHLGYICGRYTPLEALINKL